MIYMTKGIWTKNKNVHHSHEEDYEYIKYNNDDTVYYIKIVKYNEDNFYTVYYSEFSKDYSNNEEECYLEYHNKTSIFTDINKVIKKYDLNNLKNEEIIHNINDLY